MLEKKVLIVVDYQSDFVDGSLKVAGAAALEIPLAARIAQAYDDGDKVIFLKDVHPTSYMQTLEGKYLPVEHCIVDTPGAALYGKVKTLEHQHGSSTIEKLQFGTLEIHRLLHNEQIKPIEFTLAGLTTDICVISNAIILKTQFRETPVKIIASLCAGLTNEGHEAALKVAKACQVEVL